MKGRIAGNEGGTKARGKRDFDGCMDSGWSYDSIMPGKLSRRRKYLEWPPQAPREPEPQSFAQILFPFGFESRNSQVRDLLAQKYFMPGFLTSWKLTPSRANVAAMLDRNGPFGSKPSIWTILGRFAKGANYHSPVHFLGALRCRKCHAPHAKCTSLTDLSESLPISVVDVKTYRYKNKIGIDK